MKKNNLKQGISLIVLVITIIVLGILATAVIVSISNTNIMTKTKSSTFKSNMQSYKETYNIWYAKEVAENSSLLGDDVNISYASDPTTFVEIFGDNVPTEYLNSMRIENSKFVFYATNEEQAQEASSLGITPSYADESWDKDKGVNKPLLGAGMTGVYWDANGIEVEVTNANYYNWYDYSSQKWANAKTEDGSYWVWIPRYAYKFESGLGTSTAGTISVKFLQGKTDKDSTNTTISKTYPTVTNNAMDAYVVHPAFIDDRSSNFMHGGWDAELAGIWVAKYKMSNDGNNNLLSVPGVSAWRSIKIGDIYTKCLNYIPALQTHLIKNSEWGAVAYLAHSSFGRNGVEVTINDNYYTGGSQNATANTNPLQSTTGNNTGIFDMSGGSWEYVACYISNGCSNIKTYGSSFASTDANATGYQTLSTKYVTVYPYNSSSGSCTNNYIVYKNAGYGYGDTILETSTAGAGATSWFSDLSCFADASAPFFERSGYYYNNGANSGLFFFDYASGNASTNDSFRAVLAGF